MLLPRDFPSQGQKGREGRAAGAPGSAVCDGRRVTAGGRGCLNTLEVYTQSQDWGSDRAYGAGTLYQVHPWAAGLLRSFVSILQPDCALICPCTRESAW